MVASGWVGRCGIVSDGCDPAVFGQILTRTWVVDLMLDGLNYVEGSGLADRRIVDAGAGKGAFLFRIIDRLMNDAKRSSPSMATLSESLIAVEIQSHNVEQLREGVVSSLQKHGLRARDAMALAAKWVLHSDFLLADAPYGQIDFVVGNPPYIKAQEISSQLLRRYSERWETMTRTADIYVGFFEAGLALLTEGGSLSYICADRWMRNQYGAGLRDHISSNFSLDLNISLHDVHVFESAVAAYPAITQISRRRQGEVALVETTKQFERESASAISKFARSKRAEISGKGYDAARLPDWFKGRSTWPAGLPHQIAVVEELEKSFPPLESSSTKTRVGIGIATGADSIFIVESGRTVEVDRLLPLVERRHLREGRVEWESRFLVNPWGNDGNLVQLDDFPLLKSYFRTHQELLKQRHVGSKNPKNWYRTIDKVVPELFAKPKLLIPDMSMQCSPSLETGRAYPHHNLYWVTSDTWNLEVLGGLLISKVCDLFIGAHCTRMRGGTKRFQAQHLRRLPIPEQAAIPSECADLLAEAFRNYDRESATRAALAAYDIKIDPNVLEQS